MAQNVVLALTYVPLTVPVGVAVGSISATLTGSAAGATPIAQTATPGTASISFPNVAPDTYTYSISTLDTAGNVLGTPVTGTQVVTVPSTVTVQVVGAATSSVTTT